MISPITQYYHLEQLFWQAISQESQVISSDAFCYASRVPGCAFNFLFLHENATSDELKAGIAFFQARNLSHLIALHEKALPSLSTELACHSLEDDGMTTAMALNMITAPREPILPLGTLVKCVNNNLACWSQPLLTAFAHEEEPNPALVAAYQDSHSKALEKGIKLQHFVLQVDERCLCSVTLSISGESARIDDLGTDRYYQRRGFASLLLNHVLHYAYQQGVRQCYLEASSDGLQLYRRLGFIPLFNYHAFFKEN